MSDTLKAINRQGEISLLYKKIAEQLLSGGLDMGSYYHIPTETFEAMDDLFDRLEDSIINDLPLPPTT